MKKTFAIIALTALAAMTVACNGNKSNKEAVQEETAVSGQDGCMNEVTVLKDTTNADGVRTICATPSGVCSRQIDVDVKDGIIQKVNFTGGCPGNTTGVSILVKGMSVKEAIEKLEGVDCAGKGTSCPDQLSKVLRLFL